jgi:aminoglycoside phosphotransferase (APT) family kinase protein
MDAISGSTLEAAALKMEATALERTAQQLRAAVDQLWSLTSSFPSPGEDNYYGQWPGTSFGSCIRRFALKESVPPVAIFSYTLSSGSDVDLAMNLAGKLDSDDTRPILTHGDLAPHNMVDKASGNLLAILDWEMFGWYPAFWE